MNAQLTDAIYEAAFVPETWGRVLDDVARFSGGASGSLLVFTGPQAPPRFKSSPVTEDELGLHVATEAWKVCGSSRAMYRNIHNPVFLGFSSLHELMSEVEIAEDSVTNSLTKLGLHAQIGTVISMMSGEIVVFTFERWISEGSYTDAEIDALDGVRTHLARATVLAARLGLERARGSVAGMEAAGLPAAVLSGRRVLAANALFERIDGAYRIGPSDRLSLANPAADAIFRTALAGGAHAACGRSVPLPATERRGAMVVHVLPLRRAAHEIFAGDALVVVSAVSACPGAPPHGVLAALFDLTPAEARFAAEIARGLTLEQVAKVCGIQTSTARSHLKQIFRKTGTCRQSAVVTLLQSTRLPVA